MKIMTANIIRVMKRKTTPDLISHVGNGIKNNAKTKMNNTVRQSKTRSTKIEPTAADIPI
jgi:hypothetical protein